MTGFEKQVCQLLAPWLKLPCPGGQVHVVKNGEVLFDGSFGLADLERNVPNTPDTIFHVASVSKQITCMCALLLWQEGKLDIEADIRAYIPDLIAFEEPVTVLNMMNNVSGIRDQWNMQMLAGVRLGDIITQRDLLTLNSKQTKLNFPPETEYFYSNTNFTFLAEIIRRQSGMELPEFAQKRIFEPLGMDKTFIREEYTDLVPNRAMSYVPDGEGFRWVPLNFTNWGATSLHTTARDFTKFLAHYMNPTLCTAKTMGQMLTVPALKGDAPTVYACGVTVSTYKGHRRIAHDGADAGYRATSCCFPDDGLTIAITANVPNLVPSAVAEQIADLVLGLDSAPPADPLLCDDASRPIPGRYFSLDFRQVIEIKGSEDGLWASMEGVFYPLEHETGNRYGLRGLVHKLYFKDGLPWMNPAMPRALPPCRQAVFSREEQETYAGLYHSDEIQTVYRISAVEDGLELSHWRLGPAMLLDLGDGSYAAELDSGIRLRLCCVDGIPAIVYLGDRVREVTIYKMK